MKPVTEYHTSAESFNASKARQKSLSLQINQGRVLPGAPKKNTKKKGKSKTKAKRSKSGESSFLAFIVVFLVLYWLFTR